MKTQFYRTITGRSSLIGLAVAMSLVTSALALTGCGGDQAGEDINAVDTLEDPGQDIADISSDTSVAADTRDAAAGDTGLDVAAPDEGPADDTAGDTGTDPGSATGDRTDYTSVTLDSLSAYSSADQVDETVQFAEYLSTQADVPAIKVAPGGSLTLQNSKATKSGDTALGTENSGFYGFNAGVLVSSSSAASSYSETNKATSVTMTDCTVETTSIGSNGVFAFGQGAVITLDHVTITTTGGNNARGVDATYGGTVNISNSVISTQGGSCAALATDRYNGATQPKINATNVVGTTAGTGSPGIYCTGIFNVSDSTLTATGSEAVVVEGKNSVTLTNTSVSGNAKWGVMIYQSMSKDAAEGTGNFSMTGGKITNKFADGPAFFVCDTNAVIDLSGVTVDNASDTLLVAGKASTASTYIGNVNADWGTLGGNVTMTATDQDLAGEIIICDSSSSIGLTLVNSTFTGAIDSGNKSGSNVLTLDSGSSWVVTADSYLKALNNNGGTISGDGKVFVNGVQEY